jgi:hypothetical protein
MNLTTAVTAVPSLDGCRHFRDRSAVRPRCKGPTGTVAAPLETRSSRVYNTTVWLGHDAAVDLQAEVTDTYRDLAWLWFGTPSDGQSPVPAQAPSSIQ